MLDGYKIEGNKMLLDNLTIKYFNHFEGNGFEPETPEEVALSFGTEPPS